MLNTILDFLFPKKSLTGAEGSWITDEERKRIRLTSERISKEELLKRGLTSIDAVITAGTYDASPLLKKAIRTFKFNRVRTLGSTLAQFMENAANDQMTPPKCLEKISPVLCPVPLHWTRRFQRGFNQSSILAEHLGTSMNLDVSSLLTRNRPTGHQTSRNRNERLSALTGAFSISKKKQKSPRYVILIDDLCTTGATLDACAKVLKESGTEYVAGLVTALG